MTTFNAEPNNAWPLKGLEMVSSCPYCSSREKSLLHENVQDWSFGCAAGRWRYWRCSVCRSLYLSPRPTAGTISDAYGRYYTHAPALHESFLNGIKQRVKNEYWSLLFNTSIAPRLGMPGWMAPFFRLIKPWITEAFGLRQLVELPKGFLIDVGCGNGTTLKLARQLGWETLGIELDTSAVSVAQAQGLNVIQGSYQELAHYEGQADCIVCAHVMEHVHDPMQLLRLLAKALKPEGVLLLSVPNASSYLHDHYGENWRGLEAPRHLAIPDAAWLLSRMRSEGFQCRQIPSSDAVMMFESERIKRRGLTVVAADVKAARNVARMKSASSLAKQDIAQIVCTKQIT